VSLGVSSEAFLEEQRRNVSMAMKGSKTEQNLMKAFAGESQARMRYGFYADVAQDEGYVQIANMFRETAENERSHAYGFFRLLEEGTPEFTAAYPAGPVHDTATNLRAAADGELLEWGTLYPGFAQIAEEEGFNKAAAYLRHVLDVEKRHETRYRKLLANLENARVFSRQAPTQWKCLECGHVHEGLEAPKVCPVCGKPQAYFELFCESY
jgi:rubrerythrin